jgi:hypothetical protein
VQDRQTGKSMNIKSRLTIGSLGQLFNWTSPRNFAQVAAKNFIRSPKQICRDGKLPG